MYRQEQLTEIIDMQTDDFVQKSTGIERDVLNNIPQIDNFATIITGIRRCGKSTVLLQLMKKKEQPVVYFNWEDIRLAGFDTDDFTRLHREIVRREAKVLFFDEIQLVPNWEMFVHQLLREGFKVFITGSNASLLSQELGTHLTGRHLSTELFPFSYSEFCRLKDLAYNNDSLELYLQTGGIPDFAKTGEKNILQNLINDIIIRDIAVRYGLKDVESLKKLTAYLLTNTACPVSANKLTDTIGIKSATTILEYFSHLKNAYIVDFISQFSYSVKAQLRNPKKVYAIDLGLVNVAASAFSNNAGRKLENLIFLYLRRKGSELFYFKDKGECDFIIKHDGIITGAVQVCYRIDDENSEREFKGLLAALNFFNLNEGVIVTFNQEDEFNYEGKKIKLVPAHVYLQS
jgi:uncharacterized protein